MLVEARTVNGLSRTVKLLPQNKPCSINKGGAKGLAQGSASNAPSIWEASRDCRLLRGGRPGMDMGVPMCLKENQEERLACARLPSCMADVGEPPAVRSPSVDWTLGLVPCKQQEGSRGRGSNKWLGGGGGERGLLIAPCL